jgi:hypothetical protein
MRRVIGSLALVVVASGATAQAPGKWPPDSTNAEARGRLRTIGRQP